MSLEEFHCEKYVLEDAGAACVRDRSNLINFAKKYDLHLSSDYLVQSFAIYFIREDWPVEEKLNTFILRLFETNIRERVTWNSVGSATRRMKYNEKEKEKKKFEVMTLKQLEFAFAILGIGLACSSVIFLVEISCSRHALLEG